MYHVIRDVGIAAFIAGLLGVGYDWLLRSNFVDTFSESALGSFRQVFKEENARLNLFSAKGLVNIDDKLKWRTLKERFKELQERAPNEENLRIRILDSWISYRQRGIIREIEDAAAAGCKVQILLLNPYSRQVRVRGEGLEKGISYPAQDITNQIKSDLSALRGIYRELEHKGKQGNLQVKVYDVAPAFHLYEFDGSKFIGVYWRDCSSVDGTQLEIDSKGASARLPLAQRIDHHFQAIWDDTDNTIDLATALERVRKEDTRKKVGRATRIQIDPDKVDEGIEFVQKLLLPKLTEQEGFKGLLALGNRVTGEGETVILWDSNNDLQAAYSNDDLRKIITQNQREFLTTPPEINDYEIVLEELK